MSLAVRNSTSDDIRVLCEEGVLIVAGRCVRETRGGPFEMAKERDCLERPIAPTRRNAIVGIVTATVMARMVFRPQQDPESLQHSHGSGRRCHVRPLMYLVGEHADPTQSQPKHPERSRPLVQRHVEQHEEHRNGEGSDFTIRFKESPPQHVFGVHVMHPKRDEQARTDHW